VQAADMRFLFAYDRWATKQMLTVLDGLDSTTWSRPNDVGERGLGSILVHHLGASQRWRIGLQTQGTDDGPEPELEPLPTIDELRQRWQAEWVAVDAWLPTLTDGHVQYVHEGVPVWRCWSTSSTTVPSTELRRRRSSPARADHQANWT
jgi:uncharacterized damage-inducible protein DinB